MLEGYTGQALSLVRVYKMMTQEEIIEELNSRTGKNFTREYFDGMERDIEDIDPTIIPVWCEALAHSRDEVLRIARIIRKNVKRDDQDLIDDILNDIDGDV